MYFLYLLRKLGQSSLILILPKKNKVVLGSQSALATSPDFEQK